jgi:hypothetical protein
MCHTRELAFQISKEYERFSKFLPNLKASIHCHPSQCRKEFAVPDPERQELSTKNVVILIKTFEFFNSAVKRSCLVIGTLGFWMRIRKTDRNQQIYLKMACFTQTRGKKDLVHFMSKIGIPYH